MTPVDGVGRAEGVKQGAGGYKEKLWAHSAEHEGREVVFYTVSASTVFVQLVC